MFKLIMASQSNLLHQTLLWPSTQRPMDLRFKFFPDVSTSKWTAMSKLIMASETGVLKTDPAKVVKRGRLQPGKIFVADLEQGRIIAASFHPELTIDTSIHKYFVKMVKESKS